MNAVVQAPLYTVRAGDPLKDRDTVLSIWRGNLGQAPLMAAKYNWFYLHPPGAAPLVQLLFHEPSGVAVGVCSAGRRRMSWRNRDIRGGVLVDLAVTPEHRSLGPAMILQQGLIATAKRELDLLYGFPNPKAVPVFKRIGYRHLVDMVRYARVLRHGGYLGRKLPTGIARVVGALVDLGARAADTTRSWGNRRLEAQWADRADPRMDVLWTRSPHGHCLLSIRDSRYAAWRFDQSPLAQTRYLLLDDAEGGLAGWFATHAIDGTLHVRDFWSRDAARGIGCQYLDALLRAARSAGHAAVSVELAAPPAHLAGWHSRRFVERGRRPVFGRWSWPDPCGNDPELFLTSADEDE